MKLMVGSVGDPWRDWGIIALYKMLSLPTFQKYYTSQPQLTSNYMSVQFKPDISTDSLQVSMYQYIKQLMNKIVLRDPSMKALNLERKRDAEGFYDVRYSVLLKKEEIATVVERTKRRPTGKIAGVTLRRNYVGITPDWLKAVQDLSNTVETFITQILEPVSEKETTYCPVCGLPYKKSDGVAMRQNKNPFYNQHHNNKVRGYANSVETMKMCPVCNLLNCFAAYSANLPYFIGDCTNLLLPEVTNLLVLDKVYDRLTNLLDMEAPDLFSYHTNIPELRHSMLYPTLITLYFTIQYKYSAVTGELEEDVGWDDMDKPWLHRWHIVRYSKGKNVIFNAFSTVDVPHRLFDLVQELHYGQDNARKGNIVQSFLPYWYGNNKNNIDTFGRGIVEQNWNLVTTSLFRHYRENGRLTFNSINFLEKFIIQGMGEVDRLLEPKLMEDIKIIARSIGCIFKDDVGLFTNLNNAHNEAALRKVLSQVFFKMNRIKQTKRDVDLPVPGEQRIENLLNSLNSETYQAIKDTLIIFASLNALRSAKQKEDNNS